MPIERGHPEELDFEHTEDSNTFCSHCQQFGFLSPLKPRLYQNSEIPSDDDNWLQCYRCGKITERYNVRYDNDKLVPYSEPDDDPFDFNQTDIQARGRRNLEEEANTRLIENFDDIPDVNLKNELRKGNILLSYSESDTFNEDSVLE